MKPTTQRNRRKTIGRIVLHGALLIGSVTFSIPFLWLISTSCKGSDEMYPPRWIPQVPRGIVQSPYIRLRDNEKAIRPATVLKTDWERLTPPVRDAITETVAAMAPQLPAFYGPYLKDPALAEGILNRLVKRVPDEILAGSEDQARQWFQANVSEELVEEVFETVYQRLALADVTISGWDVALETPEAGRDFQWELVSGDATLVDQKEGLQRPAQEVHYDFTNTPAVTVAATVPVAMAPEMIKKFGVSLHADRSWHEVYATVELDGQRFEAIHPAYIGSDRWQESTWQFENAAANTDSIEIKTWIPLEAAGASDFATPGAARITLRFDYVPPLQATLSKYANNYREVLRMVPLGMYVKNSVFLVVMNIIGQVFGSSLVAFAFARLQWPGRNFFFVLVLATLMIPPQVTMIPVFLIFKWLGWYNTLKPLWIGSFFGSAFYIFLLRQFMLSIPKDLEDSAKIDGCGYLGIYWRVILPLIKPALAAIGIFTFMGVWNEFMGPLIYLNDQRLYPLSLGLFALQVFQGGNYGVMMAASVLMTLPVVVLFFAAQRHFIQGVTLTGIKG